MVAACCRFRCSRWRRILRAKRTRCSRRTRTSIKRALCCRVSFLAHHGAYACRRLAHRYETAVAAALSALPSDREAVVMVVGAGRGPLVRRCISASISTVCWRLVCLDALDCCHPVWLRCCAQNRRMHVYALDKNPSAVVHLRSMKAELSDDTEKLWRMTYVCVLECVRVGVDAFAGRRVLSEVWLRATCGNGRRPRDAWLTFWFRSCWVRLAITSCRRSAWMGPRCAAVARGVFASQSTTRVCGALCAALSCRGRREHPV